MIHIYALQRISSDDFNPKNFIGRISNQFYSSAAKFFFPPIRKHNHKLPNILHIYIAGFHNHIL